MAPETRQALDAELIKLAAAQVPPDLDPRTAQAADEAIKMAFLAGFRTVVLVSAALAAAGGVIVALFLERRPPETHPTTTSHPSEGAT
jgi:hypothetical protein